MSCASLLGLVSCQFARHHSESVLIFVCLRRGATWLVQSASVVCPMMCIEDLETIVTCVFFVRYTVECRM